MKQDNKIPYSTEELQILKVLLEDILFQINDKLKQTLKGGNVN